MKKLDLRTFGINLKRIVKEFNATHKENFATTIANDSQNYYVNDYNLIYRYFCGQKTPSLDTLLYLSRLLNVTPEELLS